MAQNFATSPLVIYNTLAGDSTFLGYVGDYTFETGSTSKSLAIVTPGVPLPRLQSVTGLECIIHDVGDIRRKDYVSGDSDFMTTWRLFLIAWDGATGDNITAAAKRAMSIFNGSTSVETVATSSGLKARVQTLILIPEESAINPNP
jgi:hypothetical protein